MGILGKLKVHSWKKRTVSTGKKVGRNTSPLEGISFIFLCFFRFFILILFLVKIKGGNGIWNIDKTVKFRYHAHIAGRIRFWSGPLVIRISTYFAQNLFISFWPWSFVLCSSLSRVYCTSTWSWGWLLINCLN